MGLIGHAAKTGRPIPAYRGKYVIQHYGKTDLILRCRKQGDMNYEMIGLDYIANGNCVWDLKVLEPNFDDPDGDELEKTVMVSRPDGTGTAVVNVVNADVLPSYCPGEKIKLQMNALALDVHFYENAEAYDNDPEMHKGKFGLGEGTIFPNIFDAKADHSEKTISLIRTVAKKIFWGTFKIDDQDELRTFIYVIGETCFGDLQFVIDPTTIDEKEMKNIVPGATLFGAFYLTGDAAIDEYEQGFIKDQERNYKAFRYAVTTRQPERLKEILSPDVTYFKEGIGEFAGYDAVMDRMKAASENPQELYVYPAVVTGTGLVLEPKHKAGDPCLVFAYDGPELYTAIMFLEMDENNNIARIESLYKTSYTFEILGQDKEEDEEDFKIPEHIWEGMINRAEVFGPINDKEGDLIRKQLEELPEDRLRDARIYVQMYFDKVTASKEELAKDYQNYFLDHLSPEARDSLQRSGKIEEALKGVGALAIDYDTFNKWFYRNMERRDQENALAEAYLTIDLMAETVSRRYAAEVTEKTCPYCGRQNDADAKFCSYCGKKLEE